MSKRPGDKWSRLHPVANPTYNQNTDHAGGAVSITGSERSSACPSNTAGSGQYVC